jgi:hypothetical protein
MRVYFAQSALLIYNYVFNNFEAQSSSAVLELVLSKL